MTIPTIKIAISENLAEKLEKVSEHLGIDKYEFITTTIAREIDMLRLSWIERGMQDIIGGEP